VRLSDVQGLQVEDSGSGNLEFMMGYRLDVLNGLEQVSEGRIRKDNAALPVGDRNGDGDECK